MALYDTDKTNDSRSDPAPNGADSLTSLRMSYGTQSISPVTDATTDTLQIITRDSTIELGQTAYNTGLGYWLGVDSDGIAKLSLGDSSANHLTWDGTDLSITGAIIAGSGSIGGFNIGDDYIEDVADSFGLASTVTADDDVRFWAGDTFANRATAPFNVYESGAVNAASISITGGSITGDNIVAVNAVNLASRGWIQTCVFSSVGTAEVDWTSGTFTSANGDSFSISSGSITGMTGINYIYLDLNLSITAYQVTTDPTVAVGDSKVLVAVAQNNSNGAVFSILDSTGRYIDASDIVAGSITANELSASILYAGSLQIDTSGNVRSGQTDFDTGTGWFIGNSSGTAKFSIGNSSGDKMTWDGSNLKATGNVTISSLLNNSSQTVSNLPIPPSTAGFSPPGGNE